MKITLTAIVALLGLTLVSTGCDSGSGSTNPTITDQGGDEGTDQGADAATDEGAEDTMGGDMGPAADADAVEETSEEVTEDVTPDEGPMVPPYCSAPGTVPCEDQMILELSLHDDMISDGAIVDEADGEDRVASVDATAGGYVNASQNPWLYATFTDDGLQKVEIDDFDALESEEWDIAFKRFGIRLNSGSSGPGCVGAAAVPSETYADIDTTPQLMGFDEETFYTESCILVEDNSGLPGSAAYLLGDWWEYPAGCVATTGIPFIVMVEGRTLKLTVEAYYATGQQTCNTAGTPGTDSGNLTVRWRFLQ